MYGNANPVTYLDPSGEISSLGEFSVGQALQAALGRYLQLAAAQTLIGFSQAGDSNGQLVWDAKLTGANVTALGPTVRGVVLEAETREPVNTFLTSGPFDYFEGTWIVVGAGIASLDGGVLPGLYIEQAATIRSPRILGGNPGVLAGAATFGTFTSGNLAANGFTVGFGVGVVQGYFILKRDKICFIPNCDFLLA